MVKEKSMTDRKDKPAKQRIIVWEKTDKAGNETAFAIIDFRTPEVQTKRSPPNET